MRPGLVIGWSAEGFVDMNLLIIGHSCRNVSCPNRFYSGTVLASIIQANNSPHASFLIEVGDGLMGQ
ncbi:hypothetical protein AYI68_g4943 [Smittium mucronatum]|uniref:Uncharacterized protein n=1 Tax=Smittium mucronatum TaxID=133383 RepID=A0A1R0GVM9_9FUNG|nr:hypothetical protein AYI68_g4943 [Smittium mucronatum]